MNVTRLKVQMSGKKIQPHLRLEYPIIYSRNMLKYDRCKTKHIYTYKLLSIIIRNTYNVVILGC